MNKLFIREGERGRKKEMGLMRKLSDAPIFGGGGSCWEMESERYDKGEGEYLHSLHVGRWTISLKTI